jgi:hypothetical protein
MKKLSKGKARRLRVVEGSGEEASLIDDSKIKLSDQRAYSDQGDAS